MELAPIDILLSFAPVLLLMILPLLTNMRVAAIAAFIATTALYFYWQVAPVYYFATLGAALIGTVNILMIVFGAVFLYGMMHAAGYITSISGSVQQVHPARDVRFFLFAIGLTGFFEGVAGFGTPGAIVPLLLIAMGYKPMLSVGAVLLFDGLFAAFGAVGTPLVGGLQIPLGLDDAITARIALITAVGLLAAAVILFSYTIYLYKKEEQAPVSMRLLLLLGSSALLPFVLFANWLPEFATILSTAIMMIVSILLLSGKRKLPSIRPWLPYLVLVLFLLLPKLFAPLDRALSLEIAWPQIPGTSISAAIKPLKSPLIPFFITAVFFSFGKAPLIPGLTKTGRKMAAVALLLFPIIAVAQLMLHSGIYKPSMITHIATAFGQTGKAYPFLAPFIGITGAFVTGSTTLSNIVFGASQLHTAQLLALDPSVVLAAQLGGASLGNSICLFNIIAACSVAGIREPNKILLKNLLPVLLAGAVLGVLAFLTGR